MPGIVWLWMQGRQGNILRSVYVNVRNNEGVVALISVSSDLVSNPGQGHCIVILGKTQCLSPPRLQANLILGVTLNWTCMPSNGSRNATSRFLTFGLRGLLADRQTLPNLVHVTAVR